MWYTSPTITRPSSFYKTKPATCPGAIKQRNVGYWSNPSFPIPRCSNCSTLLKTPDNGKFLWPCPVRPIYQLRRQTYIQMENKAKSSPTIKLKLKEADRPKILISAPGGPIQSKPCSLPQPAPTAKKAFEATTDTTCLKAIPR